MAEAQYGSIARTVQSSFDTRHLKADLKQRSVRGGVATVIGQGGRFVIQTASTIILARLLVPADFGLVAMVTAVTGFATLFKDLGLSMATVQRAEITHEQVSTLFWVNLAFSALIALAIVGLAPVIGWFYGEPRLFMITVAMAPVFIFGGLTVQHQALLQRQMRFIALATVQVVSMFGGVIAAVVSAMMGAGYWALVLMQVVNALTMAIGMWLFCGWSPGAPRLRSGIGEMVFFGANLSGFNILNYFARNLDNVLIGKVWGAVSLGYYSRAYTLLMLPISQITTPIAAVAIPALSRLQDDSGEYARYYYRAVNVIAFVTMPAIMLLTAFSNEVVLIVLGRQWVEVVPIFKALAFAAMVQPVVNPIGWVFISRGQTNRMFRWALFAVPVTVLGFVAGLPWGALGVAVAYTVVSITLLTFPGLWWAFRNAPLSIRGWLKSVQCPFVVSLGMYLIIEIGRYYLIPRTSYGMGLLLPGLGALIFVALAVACWGKCRRELIGAWHLLRHLKTPVVH